MIERLSQKDLEGREFSLKELSQLYKIITQEAFEFNSFVLRYTDQLKKLNPDELAELSRLVKEQ
jgi:hypothetical protein